LIVIALAIGACARHNPSTSDLVPGHPGYHVQQTVLIRTGGPEGKLELDEDSRITPAARASFQRGLPDDACARPLTDAVRTFCDSIRHQPLHSAMVRLIDSAGHELDTALLERPIANLMLVIDDPGNLRRVYGVSVDLTADMGTYSGPYVRLLDQHARRFDWLRARDSVTGDVAEVHLVTTAKAAWQVVPGPDGASNQILAVSCRPTFADAKTGTKDGFAIDYYRYAFKGNELVRHLRTERGFWEDDDNFPPRSRFP
jgi:hypothetical protein